MTIYADNVPLLTKNKLKKQLKLLVKYYQRDLLHINYTQVHCFWQSHYKSRLQRDNFIPSALKLERTSESAQGLDETQVAGSQPQNSRLSRVE